MVRKQIAYSFVLISAMLAAAFVGSSHIRSAAHGGLPACASTVIVFLPPPGTQALTDVVPVQLQADTPVSRVIFELDGEIIGRGQSISPDNHIWQMPWDTRFSESGGPYNLVAEVLFDSGNQCVTFPANPVTINNPVEFELEADIVPEYWQGPTNTVAWFNIDYSQTATGGGTPVDIAMFADIEWSAEDFGTITEKPNSTGRFYSGPQEGEGEVKATIRYGGDEVEVDATTDIIPQYGGTQAPPDEDDDDDFDSDGNGGDDDFDDNDPNDASGGTAGMDRPTTIAERIDRIFRTDSRVESCINDSFGAQLETFLNENRRPSDTEFGTIVGCFADQNYVLPSVLAPVAPDEVVSKKQSSDVEIVGIFNRAVQQTEGGDMTALVLSGRARPSSNVILYVFSEPLVLVANADDNGNWEYTLEDPLPSGEHEVYALVDRGDGEYERSTLASFVIGTAEATEANPNGYSLELVSEPTIGTNNRSVNVFIASTIGLTVFTVVAFSGFIIYRTRNKQPKTPSSDGDSGTAPPATPQVS